MAAKKPAAAQAAPAKGNVKSVERKRRSALERKCLSKAAKRLYGGATRDLFRSVLEAERHARKKDRKPMIFGSD